MSTVDQIIAAINPDSYYDFGEDKTKLVEFKKNIKENGIQKAAEKAKVKPDAEHKIVYDSATESLEPIYFFIIDLMGDFGLSPEKLIDNFSSSPGSGHFGELGQRASIMQQQASKLLGDVNMVLRSVLNIVYDLKEFRIRLQSYEDLKDAKKKYGATLSLKQIWLDKVDINKGNSSIKAMALGQAGFQTLLDAFLAVNTVKDAEKIDLNERVKRILIPRIMEFNDWVKHSEIELKKRFELEKTYLKSQVSSLKIYSRWAKPYLKAATQLETKDYARDPSMVKVFNTLLLELSVLGKSKLNVKDLAISGDLPSDFAKENFLKTLKRNYYSCLLVDFKFRGIPQRVAQQSHYGFGGKAEVTFKAYCLNDDEIAKIEEELSKDDLADVLKLVEGVTTESLEQLEKDINFFLEEKKEEKKEEKTGSNPFLALVGYYDKGENKKEDKKDKKKEIKEVKPDSWIEKEHIRKYGIEGAKDLAFKFFDVYKKAHGMESFT